MPMLGLPRSRAIHADKHIALTKLFTNKKKPQAKRQYLTPARGEEASKLITNLAYKLTSEKNSTRRKLPALRR